MLVDKCVAAQIEQQLDIALQLLSALHAVVHSRQLVPTPDGLCPEEAGNRCPIGISANREKRPPFLPRHTEAGGAPSGYPHIASHTAQSRHRAYILLTVSGALVSKTREQAGRLTCRIVDRNVPDSLSRNACDLFAPLRRLCDTIEFSEKVSAVVLFFIYIRGHVVFIKAQTEGVHKPLIMKAFRPDNIGHGRAKCSVRRRADRDPFICNSQDRIALARIDHNDLRTLLLCLSDQIIPLWAIYGFRGIVSPQQQILSIQKIFNAVAAESVSVDVRRDELRTGKAI